MGPPRAMCIARNNLVKTSPFGFTQPMRLSIITTTICKRCWSSTSCGGGDEDTPSAGTLAPKGPTSFVCSIGGMMRECDMVRYHFSNHPHNVSRVEPSLHYL